MPSIKSKLTLVAYSAELPVTFYWVYCYTLIGLLGSRGFMEFTL